MSITWGRNQRPGEEAVASHRVEIGGAGAKSRHLEVAALVRRDQERRRAGARDLGKCHPPRRLQRGRDAGDRLRHRPAFEIAAGHRDPAVAETLAEVGRGPRNGAARTDRVALVLALQGVLDRGEVGD
jgi:hypothetical protein